MFFSSSFLLKLTVSWVYSSHHSGLKSDTEITTTTNCAWKSLPFIISYRGDHVFIQGILFADYRYLLELAKPRNKWKSFYATLTIDLGDNGKDKSEHYALFRPQRASNECHHYFVLQRNVLRSQRQMGGDRPDVGLYLWRTRNHLFAVSRLLHPFPCLVISVGERPFDYI